MAGQHFDFPDKSADLFFILSTLWICGYFLLPSAKLHLQLFHFCFTLPGVWLLWRRRVRIGLPRTDIVLAALAYAACFLLSLAWAPAQTAPDPAAQSKRVIYLFLFWISLRHWLQAAPEKTVLLARVIVTAALISLIINGILFYGVEGCGLADRFTGIGRLWNPLWSGAAYGACAVLVFSRLNWPDSTLRKGRRFGYTLLFLIFATATFLTHSRGPAGAMLFVCAAALFGNRLGLKKNIALLLTSALVLAALLQLMDDSFGASIERGQSYRVNLWQGFIARAAEHPLSGFGAGARVPINAPGEFVDGWVHYHSVYVGSLVELGLSGLLLHLWLCALALRTGWRHREQLHARSALLLFAYSMIIGLTFGQGLITQQNVQWLLFWLPAIILASLPLSRPARARTPAH